MTDEQIKTTLSKIKKNLEQRSIGNHDLDDVVDLISVIEAIAERVQQMKKIKTPNPNLHEPDDRIVVDSRFKVGDKVIAIKDTIWPSGEIPPFKVGQIDAVNRISQYESTWLELKSRKNRGACFLAEYFELFDEKNAAHRTLAGCDT